MPSIGERTVIIPSLLTLDLQTTKWLTRTQEKLEEANRAATEASRRAEAANHLAVEVYSRQTTYLNLLN